MSGKLRYVSAISTSLYYFEHDYSIFQYIPVNYHHDHDAQRVYTYDHSHWRDKVPCDFPVDIRFESDHVFNVFTKPRVTCNRKWRNMLKDNVDAF